MSVADKVVLLMAVVICIDVTISVWHATLGGAEYSEARVQAIQDVLNQMIAVVILYIGSKLK